MCYSAAMVKTLTLRRTGGSVSATLPKEIAERLRVGAGDRLFVVEVDDGVLLTPFDPAFEKTLEVYGRVARKYRNALRELAK